jgi:hypothetical protein
MATGQCGSFTSPTLAGDRQVIENLLSTAGHAKMVEWIPSERKRKLVD